MKNTLRTLALLAAAVPLAVAGCDDAAGGGNSMSGTFDGVEVSGGSASSRATLDQDFLNVTIELRLPANDYGAILVVDAPSSQLEGRTLDVGTGGQVSAQVHRDAESPRAATGTVYFDVLDPVSGGNVAGSYDLVFGGGELSGNFDTFVE